MKELQHQEKAQVVSRQRVVEFGEVYTAQREVNAMLDLVAEKASDIEATFLEPACGDGNFLVAILERKLDTVKKFRNPEKYLLNVFKAVCSIYGIDIIWDNVVKSRKNMLNKLEQRLRKTVLIDEKERSNFLKAIKYVLQKNIIHADTLEQLIKATSKNKNQEKNKSIWFSQWEFDDELVREKRFCNYQGKTTTTVKFGNIPKEHQHYLELAKKYDPNPKPNQIIVERESLKQGCLLNELEFNELEPEYQDGSLLDYFHDQEPQEQPKEKQ